MKRIHILTAALLTASLAAPAALAQTGATMTNGNYANGNGYGGYGNNGYGNNGYGNNRGGAAIGVSASGVRQVQQALNRLGYRAGPVNGAWDGQTRNAMTNFQQAHGLTPSGRLDYASISALGLRNAVFNSPNGNGGARNGMAPQRGNNPRIGGGRPLPSQRIVNSSPQL